MSLKIKKLMLIMGDAAVLYFSLYLTLAIRYLALPERTLWDAHFIPFSATFVFWIISLFIFNLYSINLAVNNVRFFQLTAKAVAMAALFSVIFFYSMPGISIAPKRNLFIFIFVFGIFFFFWRQLFNWSLKSYLPKKNIAFIGWSKRVRELIGELKKNPHWGYETVFVFSPNAEATGNLPVLENPNELKKWTEEKKVSILVIAWPEEQSEELRCALFSCLPLRIDYASLPNFYEIATGKIPVEAIGQTWFMENLNEGGKTAFESVKRFFDFILALFCLIVSFPFWPIIALIVKVESRGPVFFRQKRLGKNGTIIKVIKFRSMTETGNDRAPTAENDARITRFGSFIRKTRLDEIPQMINILKGEMSFVGPRPERLELASELEKEIPFYAERTLVKPGITGWDQISGEYHSPSTEDSLKKLQYDLFYIKNRSFYLDLSIILKTIATIINVGGR